MREGDLDFYPIKLTFGGFYYFPLKLIPPDIMTKGRALFQAL